MSKLSKEGLIYYSNLINQNIVKRINAVKDMITNLTAKVEDDKNELNLKIESNKSEIDDHSAGIVDLNTKYSELKTEVDNNTCDGHPNGDTIHVNSIDQFMFTNVKEGDVLEIPNESINNDFMIECYEEVNGAEFEHKVFQFNNANESDFTYDDRYVEVTETGIKPKSSVTLQYTKLEEDEVNNVNYEIYVSDTIPAFLLESIKEIHTIEEQ